jgi:hypothetical protein
MIKSKKHQHKWKSIGYSKTGYGISSGSPIYWCKDCGAISGHIRTHFPKYYIEKMKEERNKKL